MSIFNRDAAYPVIDLIRRELRRRKPELVPQLDKEPQLKVHRGNPKDIYEVTDVVEDYGEFQLAYSIGRGYVIPTTYTTPVSNYRRKYENEERVNTIVVSLIIGGNTTKAYAIGLNYDGNGLFDNSNVVEIEA